jgi:hypothetical protein
MVGLSAREPAEHRGWVGTVEEKVDSKEVRTPQVSLSCRQSSPQRPNGLVWKRKADEARSSLGAGDGMTVLVGSVPCRLHVENG